MSVCLFVDCGNRIGGNVSVIVDVSIFIIISFVIYYVECSYGIYVYVGFVIDVGFFINFYCYDKIFYFFVC